MKITRENYESFFLDYLEGNLEEHRVDEFLEFLGMNPDLKNELHQFEAITLPPEDRKFATKQSLYRTDFEQPEIFNHNAVAWIEGDLPEKESKEFLEFVENNPRAKQELEIFKITRLIPDESVKFSRKEKLYRQPVIRKMVYRAMQIAAILLIIISIWSLWPEEILEISGPTVFSELQPLADKTIPEDNPDSAVIHILDSDDDLTSAKLFAAETRQSHTIAQAEQVLTSSGTGETLAGMRENIPLSELPARRAVIETSSTSSLLAVVNLPVITEYSEADEELYLTDRLKHMARLEEFSFTRLVKSGLGLASGVSNDRFSYDTNNEGVIVALSLDTRLLGLRIPVGRK